MARIIFIEHNGKEHAVDTVLGSTVMQAAVDNSIPGILADCGGSCGCGTCHGFVDDAWLNKMPAPERDEQSMLEGLLEAQHNSRLTCQIVVRPELDHMVVRLPKTQL